MSFKRVLQPENWPKHQELTEDLTAIGFRLSRKANLKNQPNIENTLLAGSIEGIEKPDYRLLSLLVDWIEQHSQIINLDRLTQLVNNYPTKKVKIFWVAIAQWQIKDSRWKNLAKLISSSHRHDLLELGTPFLIAKNGEDERFHKTILRVPTETLRHRPHDILPIQDLAARHSSFYYRVMIGPIYRADMWALLESNPSATATEVAHGTYGSFSTAWEVKRDFDRLRQAGPPNRLFSRQR